MKKQVLILATQLMLLVFVAGCDKKEEKSGNAENQEQKTGNESVGTDSSGQTSDTTKSNASAGKTQIKFEEETFDFGKIKQGNMVEHVFKFQNVGTAPLIISDARASCGCTTPDWPKEAIQPGGEGKMTVKYNGSGVNQIEKSVTVTANTDPEQTVIKIKAYVEAPPSTVKGPFKDQN